MSTINFPIMYFPDPAKGRPVFNGKVFIGIPDLDPEIEANQKQVFYIQENGDLVAADQPISLSAGGVPVYNGSPVTLDVEGIYSLKVLDKLDAQVYYVASTDNSNGSSSVTTEQQVQLTAGQTSVLFSKIFVDSASFYIGSIGVDRGRLIKGVDYTTVGASTVVLTNSYPDGSYLVGVGKEAIPATEASTSVATVSFIFDDGYTSAITDVLPLFKSKGMTCGFAISSSLTDSSSATYASIQAMLNAQAEGFEILNHGLDATPLVTNADGIEFARSQINGNYDKLRQYGFNVQSYVAGNSTLAPEFIPIVEERHSSAYTVNGASNSGQAGLELEPIAPYDLFRPSLFTLGLANAKLTVDAAKEAKGWVSFFDHDPTQVFFPSSMSTADLEILLDYIIAEGVQVVNPSQARQQLGDDEYKLNQEAIDESNREQGLTLVNQNLLRDPWYKTIQEDFSGWNKSTGSGDGTFTAANRKNGVFGNEIQLTVGADGTVVDGEYLYQSNAQRRESDFFPTSGNLTFSCEPYQTAAAFDDNFELTIGVNQRKTSDNSVLASIESLPMKVDTRARKYSVTIDPQDYSNASYFQVFYRITEKIIGVGASVLIANPKLEQGDKASKYTDDSPVDINDWDFAEAIVDLGATGVIVDTQLELVDVNKNFYQITGNQFLCRDTGFYSFDLYATGISGGPHVDVNTIVTTVKNGVSETKILERVSNGTRLVYDQSQTRFLKSGDTLHWLLSQAASGLAIDIDTGVRSYLRICKIN